MVTVVNGVKIGTSHRFLLQKLKYYSKEQGYCYALNKHLGKDLSLSPTRISHLLSDLRRASLIDVLLIYDTENKLQVIGRRIRVVAQTAHSVAHQAARHIVKNARGIVKNSKVQKGDTLLNNVKPTSESNDAPSSSQSFSSNDIKTGTAMNPLAEQVKHGVHIGIPANITMLYAGKFGITRVREAIAICAESKSARNIVAYFVNAIKKGYKPNRVAKKMVNKDITRRKPIDEVVYTQKEISGDGSFAREMLTKMKFKGNPSLVKALRNNIGNNIVR